MQSRWIVKAAYEKAAQSHRPKLRYGEKAPVDMGPRRIAATGGLHSLPRPLDRYDAKVRDPTWGSEEGQRSALFEKWKRNEWEARLAECHTNVSDMGNYRWMTTPSPARTLRPIQRAQALVQKALVQKHGQSVNRHLLHALQLS